VGTITSSGSTIVTARTGRFRRRIAVGLVALVLLLIGGGVALAGGFGGGSDDTASSETVTVPDAVLPDLGEATPVLASLDSAAPAPDPGALAAVIGPLLQAPGLGSAVSAEVVDVETGEVLLDLDGDSPAVPASTAKLLTAAAALTSLDPAQTLATTVVAGSAPGEVVLVGGGDPTLSRTSPSQNYPGAATVADLAAQVVAALPGTTVTRVVVDSSLFTGPPTAQGWGPADAPSTYAAPVTAAAVDGARVSSRSQARSGQPGIDAGVALADALGAPGATVVLGEAQAGAEKLAEVRSAPVARLVEQALSGSDNVLAEALARQVALSRELPASFEGAAEAVVGALGDAGVDTSGVRLADGSGLSRLDQVPAGVLTGIVAGAADGSLRGASALLSGLPVAGYDGTLFDRGDADTAPGVVRAKTGTLLGVHALSGTAVTAQGRLLAFAVIADESGSEASAEAALDDVAAALAACGCS
jgi:serine-type D-Ala-D-Ala carboxypeptidase/endopeptidase (penicillin-binding protein 4)